jgi:hypothetical protein
MSETDTGRPDPEHATEPSTRSGAVQSTMRPGHHPRFFRMFVRVGIAVLLLGAVGLGVSQLFLFAVSRDAAAIGEIASLRSELRAMNSRLATMEQAASGLKTDAPSGDLATQSQALDSRLGRLEMQIARTADRDTLTALQDRVARLERDGEGASLHRAAALLAAANLARAAEQSGPFRTELEALRAVAPEDAALSRLEPVADAGVPTRAMLTSQFPELARSALDAEREDGVSNNLFSGVWAGLRKLISIRRIGAVEGNTPEDRLARAQVDSDLGDLGGAATELRAISGRAAAPLKPWLKEAEARLDVDSAVAEMNARVAKALGTPTTLSVTPP